MIFFRRKELLTLKEKKVYYQPGTDKYNDLQKLEDQLSQFYVFDEAKNMEVSMDGENFTFRKVKALFGKYAIAEHDTVIGQYFVWNCYKSDI